MFGAIFFCVEEVHRMSDLIELKLVTEGESESLHRLQVEAFMPLYEKYQDDDTSPAKESLKRVTEKIIEENSDFYCKRQNVRFKINLSVA